MTAEAVAPADDLFRAAATHRAAKSPCVNCPWRIENQGKRHPDGWYTKANLKRLWGGLRRGEQMTCHPTDPNNPVSDEAVAKGYRPAPEHAVTRECAGAIILQQRELQVFNDLAEAHPEANVFGLYRVTRPGGMTREGLLAFAGRLIPWPGEIPMRRDHDLNEPVGNGSGRLRWPW